MSTQLAILIKALRILAFVGLPLLTPILGFAGPAEDANAAIDRWSSAYTSNDVDAVVNAYWSDAILLGTSSPVISTGADAIRAYFTALKLQGSGNRNEIQERHTLVLDDNAVVVTGFYQFTRMAGGTPTPAPSRYTMVVTRRDAEWRIAHHHLSPRVQPKK